MSASHRGRGFTLIELIIAMVIISLLAAVTAQTIYDASRLALLGPSNVATLSKLGVSLERMAKEIRETNVSANAYQITVPATIPASNSTTDTCQITFTKWDATQINIYRGSSNGTVSCTATTIFLQSGSTGSNVMLTDNVTAFKIRFFPINGTTSSTAATTATLAFIEIDLTLQDPVSGTSYSHSVRVSPRYSTA